MISKVSEINSTGDAMDFIEDNWEYLEKMERYISLLKGYSHEPYRSIVEFFENYIAENYGDVLCLGIEDS